MSEVRCQVVACQRRVIACQRSSDSMESNSRYYPSMQLASKQMNIQAKLSSARGTDSE